MRLATYTYDAMPSAMTRSGACSFSVAFPNAYKFTGKERDAESNLDDFGARYYSSSSLGRYMTPDWSEGPEPVPYADFENPQALNLYGYVENNPLNLVDLEGHAPAGE